MKYSCFYLSIVKHHFMIVYLADINDNCFACEMTGQTCSNRMTATTLDSSETVHDRGMTVITLHSYETVPDNCIADGGDSRIGRI